MTDRPARDADYATQMDAARRGILTPQLIEAAASEGIEPEYLRALVSEGRAVIPANRNHSSLRPRAIGRPLSTKINVNLGTSKDCPDPEREFEKVRTALSLGADALMDLSTSGDTAAFRRRLIAESTAMIGTVPAYDTVVRSGKALRDITARDWLETVRIHAEDGADFQTIHCGLTRDAARRIRANERVTGIVSRGGSLLFAWMEMTGNENPYYQYFDEILDVCARHDVTLSLGDACRPGCTADSSDAAQV